uniref:(northern house mosquito) hypothetical protein n=1 Tax=Culex pipiens TaxID=7175 RepID=A0A8D8AI22_CULPI
MAQHVGHEQHGRPVQQPYPPQDGGVVFVMLLGQVEQLLHQREKQQQEQYHKQRFDHDEEHETERVRCVPPVLGRFEQDAVDQGRRGSAEDRQEPAETDAAGYAGGKRAGGGGQLAWSQLGRDEDRDGHQG